MRKLLQTTAEYAVRYLEGLGTRNVAPTEEAIANLIQFDQPLPNEPVDPELVLQQLDELGSPTSIAQAGSRFFGLVTGGSLPAALAANWLAAASLLVLDYSSLAQAMVTLPMGVLATSSRNKVLLLLAYTTGLRVSEICGLIIINPLPSLWTE